MLVSYRDIRKMTQKDKDGTNCFSNWPLEYLVLLGYFSLLLSCFLLLLSYLLLPFSYYNYSEFLEYVFIHTETLKTHISNNSP